MAKGIKVAKREGAKPTIQIAVRVAPELARALRVYAVTNDVLVQSVVEAGIRAVIGEAVTA